jgi:hypothetical protein
MAKLTVTKTLAATAATVFCVFFGLGAFAQPPIPDGIPIWHGSSKYSLGPPPDSEARLRVFSSTINAHSRTWVQLVAYGNIEQNCKSKAANILFKDYPKHGQIFFRQELHNLDVSGGRFIFRQFGEEDARKSCAVNSIPMIGIYYLPDTDVEGIDSVTIEIIDGDFIRDHHFEIRRLP